MAAAAQADIGAMPEQDVDLLFDRFRDPPTEARPRVWWHWLNGNITEDGIVKDLEWMKRVGVGGVQAFDAALMTPQIVEHRLAYMSPDWSKAFSLATRTADRLGLELAIAASPGWSVTGGPWVSPADAMKKLVWSETVVAGGRRYAGRLPAPPDVTGSYQYQPYRSAIAGAGSSDHAPMRHYAEVAVLAYPLKALPVKSKPRAFAGTRPVDVEALVDEKPDTVVEVSRGQHLEVRYPKAVTIRSASIFLPNGVPPFGEPEFLPELQAQEGDAWRKVAALPLDSVPTTAAFVPVTASAFRLVFSPNPLPARPRLSPPAPGAVVAGIFPTPKPAVTIPVAQLTLHGEDRVDRVEAKAGYATVFDYHALGIGLPDVTGIDPSRVIDLQSRMRPDGTLNWTPPPGRWRVVRLGASLLGSTNHPASPEATGFEVDKYDGAAVDRYLKAYLNTYRAAAGPDWVGRRGVTALLTDSFEAGKANWTPRLLARFREMRGYDPVPFLPTLTGAIVGSRAKSDMFLYDYRRTLAELLAKEHYGTVARVAGESGLTLYGEALEDGRPALGDDMAMRRYADVPMAAMWTFPREGGPRPTLLADVRGAASVAHVYGRKIIAAESFTSAFAPWASAPADLKRVADLEFVLGVNRPVIHTSVHQPTDNRKPGLSLAIFGQYFNRHETWADMARPWIDYLARTSFLLQQGRNHADVAYFYGEEAPLTALNIYTPLDDIPARYAFDFVNADVILDEMSPVGSMIHTKGGARYRALYLGNNTRRMTLPVLRRIAWLVREGVTVIGQAPVSSPSLGDNPVEFGELRRLLWSGEAVTQLGRGQVIAVGAVEAGLARAGLAPDFEYVKPAPDSEVLFAHRSLPEGELYFLSNRRNRQERIDARFRVTGLQPEVWRADDGVRTPVDYRPDGAQTAVRLMLNPEDAVFVLFRRPTQKLPKRRDLGGMSNQMLLSKPWAVSFKPAGTARVPAAMRMLKLKPLQLSSVADVRYFSGVATYETSFRVPGRTLPKKAVLDLGSVGDIAEIIVNGKSAGSTWRAPFRIDITNTVRSGDNRLEIRVANLWANRLIGDARSGSTKSTWTALPTYEAHAPLRPSGLIGPVSLDFTR